MTLPFPFTTSFIVFSSPVLQTRRFSAILYYSADIFKDFRILYSGLVSYCLTGVHALLGTTCTFMGWPRVSEPVPGDICTSINHCGIYIGGGQMIHAPQFGDLVKIGSVQSDMIFVRRP